MKDRSITVSRDTIAQVMVRMLAGAALPALAIAAVAPSAGLAQTDTPRQDEQFDNRPGAGEGDIIVTARRREELLQDVPIAITAVTSEELRNKSIATIYDMMSTVPGLNVNAGGGGRNNPAFLIRGQGQGLGLPSVVVYFAEAPLNELTRSGGLNSTYYDLASVQVLKGPQGTLFGRSTTGGAVLYTPKRPDGNFDGYAEVTYGNYNQVTLQGAINIPILDDRIALRVAGSHDSHDGYSRSINTGQELDDRNITSIRLSLLLKPTDWLSNYTVFQNDRTKEAGDAYPVIAVYPTLPRLQTTPGSLGRTSIVSACNALSAAGSATNTACVNDRVGLLDAHRNSLIAEYNRVRNGGDDAKRLVYTGDTNSLNFHTQLMVNHTEINFGSLGVFGDLTLKNIFSMTRVLKARSVRNQTSSSAPSGVSYIGVGYDRTARRAVEDGRAQAKWGDIWTEEVQLSSKVAEKHDLLLGYSIERTNKNGQLNTPALFSSFAGAFNTPAGTPSINGTYVEDYFIKQGGFFGQATIDMSEFGIDHLKFTGGYRRSFYNSSLTSFPGVFTVNDVVPNPAGARVTTRYSENASTYNFSLDYKITPRVLIYATTRRGFKSGGANNPQAQFIGLPGVLTRYEPEILTDYEVGTKADWNLGGMRGRTNVAVYHSMLNGQQRNTNITAPNGTLIAQTSNLGRSRFYGLEMENYVNLTEAFRLSLAYAFIDAKILAYPGTETNDQGVAIPLVNSPVLNTPRHKLDVTAAYTLPLPESIGNVTANATVSYQSETILSDDALFQTGYEPQKGYAVVNARINWDNVAGNPIDISFFVRNLTKTLYRIYEPGRLINVGARNAFFSAPRTFGVSVRARFGRSAD